MNVANTCHCDIGMLKKYIKIDDFNYEENENLHSADEIYYGYEVRLDLLQVTTGFIVFIPGYGRFPWGIAYEYIDDDIELFLLGIEGPLKIPEDSMIIFNLRGKRKIWFRFVFIVVRKI